MLESLIYTSLRVSRKALVANVADHSITNANELDDDDVDPRRDIERER